VGGCQVGTGEMSVTCTSEPELPATGSSETGSSEQVDSAKLACCCFFASFIGCSSHSAS
jgi:hypothetical protein